jgi:nicotinamide mononucleotide transporter
MIDSIPWLEAVATYGRQNWFELLAAFTGFVCVYLNARENPWGWPISIVSAFCYIFIFYEDTFYADMVLQGFFIVVGFYGWYEWRYGDGRQHTALKISRISRKQVVLSGVAGVVLSAFVSYLLSTQTNARQPIIDSTLSVFSLIAQYLLARKILENWLIWIGVDIFYVPVFLGRGRYVTAALYFTYLVLAVMGYLQWRKRQAAQKQTFLAENDL